MTSCSDGCAASARSTAHSQASRLPVSAELRALVMNGLRASVVGLTHGSAARPARVRSHADLVSCIHLLGGACMEEDSHAIPNWEQCILAHNARVAHRPDDADAVVGPVPL